MDSQRNLCLEITDGFSRANFCKSFSFSPDGSSFVASSEDGNLYCYADSTTNTNNDDEVPTKYEYTRVNYPRSEPVYDIKWYPFMNAQDPTTCCFVSCSKDHPIHLWDSNGTLRCTYKGHNFLDELDWPISLSFNLTGDKIYAGSERMIRCFDVANPTSYSSHPTSSSRRDKNGQKGLISCIEFNPDYSGCYAAGSYSNSVSIYVENAKGSALDITDLPFGVTSLKWSKCGNYLFIGGRRSDAIKCWDVRKLVAEVGQLERKCSSSQKMSFDVDPSGQCLWTGSQDGRLLQYDVTTLELGRSLDGLPDCVNSVHCHPHRPGVIGLCTGQRHFDIPADSMSTESDGSDSDSDSEIGSDSDIHRAAGCDDAGGDKVNSEKEKSSYVHNLYSAIQIWSV